METVSFAMGLVCLVVLAECGLMLRNLANLASLERLAAPAPDRWPRVSVIMAARDEAAHVGAAVASRLADDYPDLEVLLIDDRSVDGTGRVARAAAAGDPRFQLIRINELPAGWLGKVHALQQGCHAATGEWLLFSDGDVTVKPGTVRRAVGHCENTGIDQLALVPSFRSDSFLMDGAWAVFLRGLIVMADPARVRDPSSKVAMGSGGFNLVRRTAYEATDGFEHLRMETADDVALAASVKQSGGCLDVVDGSSYARVHLYGSIPELLRGIEKNGSTTAGVPFPLLVFGLLLLTAALYTPFAAMMIGIGWGSILGGVTLTAYTATEMYALWRNTGRWAPGLIWPLAFPIMAFAIIRATWLAHRNNGVRWRDTFYTLEELETGRRFTL